MTGAPSAEASERALVARAAGGDRSAFGSLVYAHRAAVYRYLVRMTGDGTQAEDALQETFLAALRALPGWRREGPLRTWLFAIARSRVLMVRRRKVDAATAPAEVSVEELGLRAGWGAPDPEALAQRVEQRAALEKALDTLPHEEREAVVLRDLEGLSGEAAAEVMGVTLAAMKSRLHRGRLKLVATLKTREPL